MPVMQCVWCEDPIETGDDFYLFGYREGFGVSSPIHAGHCRYMMDMEVKLAAKEFAAYQEEMSESPGYYQTEDGFHKY